MVQPPGTLSGRQFGAYLLGDRIGVGGMGEVYLARDTNLGRQVAAKVLTGDLADDAAGLARFEREARLLASLNHPNIAIVHGVEESNGVRALIMELIEGPTLEDRLQRGPLPTAEALAIGASLAEALSAAHDKGIVHRDLKPANIKITPAGTVKVLDFGLAKAVDGHAGATSGLPTLPDAHTAVGVVVGTPAYMSPEQARGADVDKRTDIWAFGCVVFEMITGQRAFPGASTSDIIAAILKSEPAWDAWPASAPFAIQTIVRRCLEKDVRRRLRDIHDVSIQLQDFGSAGVTAPLPPDIAAGPRRSSGWRTALIAAIGASAVTALAANTWLRRVPPTDSATLTRLMVTPPPDEAITISGNERDFALSPDGRHLAYIGGNGAALFVRDLQGGAVIRIDNVGLPHQLFFSPDGEWIGFMDATTALKKVSVRGGTAETICRITTAGARATWLPDDTIVFNELELYRVSAKGGTPTLVASPDRASGESAFTSPEALPHARAVLVTNAPTMIAEGRTVAINLEDGSRTVVLTDGVQPRYLPSGHLIYRSGPQIKMVAFDANTLKTSGEARVVPEPIFVTPFGGVLNVDGAANGTLVYIAETSRGAARQLVWVDRAGVETPLDAPVRAYTYATLAPNGLEAALDIRDEENDIWIWHFANKTLRRFTFGPQIQQYGLWTRDSRRIAFTDLGTRLRWQAADGSGEPTDLASDSVARYPNSFTPDTTALIMRQNDATTGHDLVRQPLPGGPWRPLLATPANELNAEISPDGQWMAYESDETGRYEIYVRTFPDVSGGRWQISHSGGRLPLWSKDGRELYFVTYRSAVMATTIAAGSTFVASEPVRLFEHDYYFGGAVSLGRTYDVADDGRFLMIKRAPGPPTSIMVVLNWR